MQRTPILVVWKRAYLELDNMYQRGATITATTPISTGATTTLTVDNTEHFRARDTPTAGTPGAIVIIFTRNPFTVPGSGGQSTSITREVINATPTSIEVDRIGVVIPEWGDVKLADDSSVYNAPTNLIEVGYGDQADGSDGGAFVESKRPIQGGRLVPHHGGFATVGIWATYSRYWFANFANAAGGAANNTFQLLTARQITDDPSTFGITNGGFNISTAFIRRPAVTFALTVQAETMVHELEHQFSLNPGTNGHVDQPNNAPNILPPSCPGHDDCIMSYNNDVGAGHVKFDTACYGTLRAAGDPR